MSTTPSFTTKDYVTISLSLIALIFTSLNFYFSNYREVDRLEARILDAGVIYDSKDKGDDTLTVDIAYINRGNRQAIVMRPWFYHAPVPDDSSDVAGYEVYNRKDFPQIIEPSKIKPSTLKIPFSVISLNMPDHVLKDTSKTMHHQYLKFQFFALDSKAIIRDNFSTYQIELGFLKGKFLAPLCLKQKDKNEFRDYRSTIVFDGDLKSGRKSIGGATLTIQ